MKKKSFLYILLSILSIVYYSCQKDDYTGYSTVVAVEGVQASLTWDTAPPSSIVEEDKKYPFTITLNKAQVVDIHIYAEQTGGDAESKVDFDITDDLVIPAGSTSVSGELKILRDKAIEGTETLTFVIGDERTANASFAGETVNMTIENYIYPNLEITSSWEKDIIYHWTLTDSLGNEFEHTDTLSACEYADIDLLVFDADQNDLGIYDGATSSCPEHISLSGDLADGDYYIWANLYELAFSTPDNSVVTLPITTVVEQFGKMAPATYSQTNSSVILSTDPAETTLKPVIKVTKVGTNYTVTAL